MSHTNEKFLTREQVQDRYNVTSSSIYRWIDNGTFPRPVKFSQRFARWRLSDLVLWEQKQQQV